jgi:hypothetical protein
MKLYLSIGILFIFCLGLNYSLPLSSQVLERIDLQKHLSKIKTIKGSKEECNLCYFVLPLAKDLIIKNQTKSFREIANLVCLTLNIANDASVCEQAVGIFEVFHGINFM